MIRFPQSSTLIHTNPQSHHSHQSPPIASTTTLPFRGVGCGGGTGRTFERGSTAPQQFHSQEISAMQPFKLYHVSDLIAEAAAEDAFQATLSPKDKRHRKMFEISPCKEWLSIYWGGYDYPYELSRLERPDDLIWLVVHLAEKEWECMTASRVGHLIKSVARIKGWPMYGRTKHPNEAPKPNHDKIAEREKMTAAVRYAVIKRDAYRCRCCGFAVQDGAHLHVDHIVAVANGGRTELANLQTLCTVCNLGKAAK